jgi:hypothetical protein
MMTMKEMIDFLGLDSRKVKKYYKEVLVKHMLLGDEATLDHHDLVCKAFPKHKKVMLIECDEDDKWSGKVIGVWDGQHKRLCDRQFRKVFGRVEKARRVDKKDPLFRTYPTVAEIEKMRKEDEEKVRLYQEEVAEKKRTAEILADSPKEPIHTTVGIKGHADNNEFVPIIEDLDKLIDTANEALDASEVSGDNENSEKLVLQDTGDL